MARAAPARPLPPPAALKAYGRAAGIDSGNAGYVIPAL